MNLNWKKNEDATGVLTVTVDGDAWQQAQKKAFNKLKGKLNIKGFRPGMVPENVAKKMLPKQEVYYNAIDALAPELMQQGVEENNIELIAVPSLKVESVDDDKAVLVFECQVTPDVILGQYKDLEAKKEPVEVSEAELEQEIKRIQDHYADWIIRDEEEPAQAGDTVNIDYIGFMDEVPFEGGEGKGYDLELGSNTFIPGFEEQIIGMKAGETKEIQVTFPKDYQEGLAGKEATFKVTVNEVKYKELPEANDDLVKKLEIEGIETLEEYKKQAEERLTAQKEEQADQKFTDAVVEQLLANNNVAVPAVMVEDEAKRMLERIQQQFAAQNITLSQLAAAMNTDVKSLLESYKPQAENRVKVSLILEAIADKEDIKISQEEMDNEYQLMSDMYQMPVEKIKEIIKPEDLEYDLKQQAALKLVKESVKAE